MILSFTDAALATGGGKAANLGELQRAGLPVPDGFVIEAATYRRIVTGLDIGALLQEGASAVRAAVENRPVPDDLRAGIAEALHALGEGTAVAVRSSATAEDLPDASFAGQQDTFLGVSGLEDVLDAVRRCWGSLWTDRAVDYRERNGFDHTDVALAVVVQRLVDAETAGVLFTTNPVTGADEALVSASWGLGESVVSGAVTPDELRATPEGILERRVGAKETRIDRDGPSTRTTVVPARDRQRLCLDDGQVLHLVDLGRRVTRHFGVPMDIEWAFADERLWLLQARPITTTAPTTQEFTSPTTTVGGRRIGKVSRRFHADLVEHYPGPFPLDVAAILRVHHRLQEGMSSIGIHSTPIEDLVAVDDDGTVTAAYPDVRLGRRLMRLLHYGAPDPAGWPAVEAEYRRRLETVVPAELGSVEDTDLFAHLDGVLSIVDEVARVRFLDYVGPTQLLGIRLDAYLRLARRRDLDGYDLLGDLDYTTAVIDDALHDLARLDPDSEEFARARERFLDEHGARTTKMYLPFSNRSWREDPAAFDASLEALRRGRTDRPTVASHDEIITDVVDRLPAFARRGFTRTVAVWRAGHIAREASVYLIEEAYVTARRVTDEMARRLVERGALTGRDDVKYLTLDEVRDALHGRADAESVRDLVSRRVAARPRAAAAWWAGPTSAGSDDLVGVAGSAGIAAGPVSVITGPEDFHRLQAGDILVCRYTDPSWTPLFGLAAAVVADTGGRLSHAAIVAREYGIPAVMGAVGATARLTEGQLVTVDGARGTVTTGH